MSCLHAELPEPIPFTRTITVAAAAIYDADGRVLIAQHMKPKWRGYWEFPGGKVEERETPEAALVRELKEELDITTCIPCLQPLGFASHTYADIGHVIILLYGVRQWQGSITPLEGQPLQWVFPADLRTKNLLPADGPLIHALIDSVA
jgi:8-oxo-dGTP diphosphatase